MLIDRNLDASQRLRTVGRNNWPTCHYRLGLSERAQKTCLGAGGRVGREGRAGVGRNLILVFIYRARSWYRRSV